MKTPSLRWHLIRNLIVLQATASILVLAGVIALFWSFGRFVDENGDRTAETLAASLRHSPEGELVLGDDPAIRWLLKASPDLWFIARDGHGHEMRYGDVPPRYLQLIQDLNGMARASLDLSESIGRPAARFERVQSTEGPINLVVKTGSPYSLANKFKWWTIAFLVLVAPTMLVTSLVVVVATPFVIRRGLRGVTGTAAQAENMNVHALETRLSVQNVPAEILPLVTAVNHAFNRLEEGYSRQARFLADAAHELRTPITTLRIQTDALPESEHKAPLVRATTRLMTLAEQLLDLQRIEHASATLGDVDLRAMCERVAADLAPLAIMSGCAIAVEAPEAVMARADETAIERAVSNLVQNAIEHGGPGEIEVLVKPPGTIVVNDSGPGIPAEERALVLEPFHRIRPRGNGAGLGLHLVDEVVQLHGGRLIVGESPTGGASMRIDLPARPRTLKSP